MGFAGTFLAYGVASADEPPTGYLAVRARPDLVKILPPPPDPGSARWRADMQAFRQSRSLRDTARWQRATADADEAPAALERDFSCAAGRVLSGPALTRLLSRIAADEDATTEPAKLHWARPRPFVGNDEPICVPRTAKIAASPDYPSGHSTLGWSVASIPGARSTLEGAPALRWWPRSMPFPPTVRTWPQLVRNWISNRLPRHPAVTSRPRYYIPDTRLRSSVDPLPHRIIV
jgi:hypothetical protein